MADETTLFEGNAAPEEPQQPPQEKPQEKKLELNPDWDIDQFIDAYGKHKGVPPAIIQSIRQQESTKGKHLHNDYSGAQGEFQYLPSTAKDKGIDPNNVFEAAAQTINDFADRYKKWRPQSDDDTQAWHRVIASHYSGEGAVDQAIREGKYVPELHDPQNVNAPTTPEYVQQVWDRAMQYAGAQAGTQEPGTQVQAPKMTEGFEPVNVEPINKEAQAYEAIANAPQKEAEAIIKKMKPEEKKAYDEWVKARTTEAELKTPTHALQAYGATTPRQLAEIEKEQKQPEYNAFEVPSTVSQTQIYSTPPGEAAPSINEREPEKAYNRLLTQANQIYAKGQATGDWSEYNRFVKTANFAPTTFVPKATDITGQQAEIENAIRTAARQVSQSDFEINNMIAEWRSRGEGAIHLYDPQTGNEMVPQPGVPFTLALPWEYVIRLRDHALALAKDKQEEMADGVSGTAAYLGTLARALRANGVLQYLEGKTISLFDDKLGKDWASFGYDPAQQEYYNFGGSAADFGIPQGTDAYNRVQSKLDAANMAGMVSGELIKMLYAHKAVGALEEFLDPKLRKVIDPLVRVFAKGPAAEITTLAGEVPTNAALVESAKAFSARFTRQLTNAATWGGFNTLQPEKVQMDWGRGLFGNEFMRGIQSTDIDKDGNLIFHKEGFVDVATRYGRELRNLMIIGSMIFPVSEAARVTITNPKLRDLIKPIWNGVAAERGINRADSELMLMKTINNPAILNQFTQAIAAPTLSFLQHPNLDWKQRLIDISGLWATGTFLHAGVSKAKLGEYYIQHPDTKEIYRANVYQGGVTLDTIKEAPKGVEVYKPVDVNELNIWSTYIASQYGSPTQKKAMFENLPDAPIAQQESARATTAPAVSPEAAQGVTNATATERTIPTEQGAGVRTEAPGGGVTTEEPLGAGAVGGRVGATAEQPAQPPTISEATKPAEAVAAPTDEAAAAQGREAAPAGEAAQAPIAEGTERPTSPAAGQILRDDRLAGKKIKSGTDRYELTGKLINRRGKMYAEAVTPSGNKFPLPLDEVYKETKLQPMAMPAAAPAREPAVTQPVTAPVAPTIAPPETPKAPEAPVETPIEAPAEKPVAAPDYTGKNVISGNTAYKLTGKTEKRGNTLFYEGTDAKGNTKLIPEDDVLKKRYWRIQSLFDQPGEENTSFRDRVRKALVRFGIDRSTRHFDITDLGKAKTTDDNTLYLDPVSSRQLTRASKAAYDDGALISNPIDPGSEMAFTQQASELKKLIPYVDNPELKKALESLQDGHALVLDVYNTQREIAKSHESVHQHLFPLQFKPGSIEALGASDEFKRLRKELEKQGSYYGEVNDHTLAHEAMAFGITGDAKGFGGKGVDRHILEAAASKALKQLVADNPDVPIDQLKKLALGSGRDIVDQYKRDERDSKTFGFSNPFRFAQHRKNVVDNTNPETVADAHEQTTQEFNNNYATSIPVQDRAAIISDIGKDYETVPIPRPQVGGIETVRKVPPQETSEIIPIMKTDEPHYIEHMASRFYDLSADGEGLLQQARGSQAKLDDLVKKAGYDGYYVGDNDLPGSIALNHQLNLFGEPLTTGKKPGKPRGPRRAPIEDTQKDLFSEEAYNAAKEAVEKDTTLTPEEKSSVGEALNVIKRPPGFKPTKAQRNVAQERLKAAGERAKTAYQAATKPQERISQMETTPPPPAPEPGQQTLFPKGDLPENLLSYFSGLLHLPPAEIADRVERLRAAALAEGLDITPRERRKPIENRQDALFRLDEAKDDIVEALKKARAQGTEELAKLKEPAFAQQQLPGIPESAIQYPLTSDEINQRMNALKAAAKKAGLTPDTKRLPGESKTDALYRIEEETSANMIKQKQDELFAAGRVSKQKVKMRTAVEKGVTAVGKAYNIEQAQKAQQAFDFETPQVVTPEAPPQRELTPREIAMKLRGFQQPAPQPQEERVYVAPPEEPAAKQQPPANDIAAMLRAAREQAAQAGVKSTEAESKPLGNTLGDRLRRIAEMVDTGNTQNLADTLRNIANELTPTVNAAPELKPVEYQPPSEDRLEKMKRLANSLTPKYRLSEAPEEFLKNQSYVIITGNKARAMTDAGRRANEALSKELSRKGFDIYQASGRINGKTEDSFLVPVKDRDEIDLLKGIAFKYGQGQIFASHNGSYYSPTTDGQTLRENFSRSNRMVFGPDATSENTFTTVYHDNGSTSFAVPDLFNASRASRISSKQQKIFDSVGFEAQFAKTQGFSGKVAERVTNMPQSENLADAFAKLDTIYGRRFPRKDKIEVGEQLARYINDWTGTVRDIIDNGMRDKTWFSDDVNRMYTTLAQEFPGIDSSKAARLAFATMIATTSPRATITSNYESAKDVFKRFIRSLDQKRPNVPTTQELGESYGYATKGLDKLDKIFNGYTWNPYEKKMQYSRAFKNDINKYGMSAVFDYLFNTGDNRMTVAQDVFGPKVGSFLMNVYGNTQIPTVDSWIVRSWRLNNGKMFNGKGELNDSVGEGLGNRIRGSIQSIAARLNQEGYDVTPLEVQSLIWSHMKGMTETMTGKTSVSKYDDAAQRSLKNQPAELTQFFDRYGQALEDSHKDIGLNEYINRAKSKSRILYKKDEDYLRDLRDDVFYSALERGVEGLPDKFTKKQLEDLVSGPGTQIKKEELEWSFVPKMLELMTDKGTYDKQDAINQIRKNRVKLYEFNSVDFKNAQGAYAQYLDAEAEVKALNNAQKSRPLTEDEQNKLEDAQDRASYWNPKIDFHYAHMERVPVMRQGEDYLPRGVVHDYGGLSVPGSANHRAYLVKQKGLISADGHYNDGDSIASLRVTDRLISNNTAFNVEEVQSDHFQKAKKEGFLTPEVDQQMVKQGEDITAKLDELKQEREDLRNDEGKYYYKPLSGGDFRERWAELTDQITDLEAKHNELINKSAEMVRPAQLESNWHEVMLKRAVMEAARQGYKKLSIVAGDDQVLRARFGKRIAQVSQSFDDPNQFKVHYLNYADKENTVNRTRLEVQNDDKMTKAMRRDVLEAIDHLSNNPDQKVYEIDKVYDTDPRAKNMRKWYDQTFPDYLREIAQEHGSTLEENNDPGYMGIRHKSWVMDVTPTMGDRMPLYRKDERKTDLLQEPDKEATSSDRGYETYEDSPGVTRHVIRASDGTIMAAAQVANINGNRKLVDFQVSPEYRRTGAGAFILNKMRGVDTKNVNSDDMASEVAYNSPQYRIDYPQDEQGWLDFAEKLKGSPLTAEDETHVRTQFQNDPSENHMVLATVPFRKDFPEFLLKVYKAGLLTGVGTTATNVLSNTGMLALEELSKVPASLLDAFISKSTGLPRQILGPSIGAIKEGLKGARYQGWEDFKEALQKGDFDNIYQIPVKAGIPILDDTVGKGADMVFRFMSGQDKIFKGYAFRRAIYEQAKLEELNGGRKFADAFADPTLEQVDMALRAATYATFQQDNIISKKYAELKVTTAKDPRLKPLSWILDLNLPFVRTGTNIALNGLEYMGINFLVHGTGHIVSAIDRSSLEQTGKNLLEVLKDPETRRNMEELGGRGLVGYALMYAGYKLAQAGLMTTDYDDKDKKELNAQAERNAPFLSLRVGNRWLSFQRLSPVGAFFASGAKWWADRDKSWVDNTTDIFHTIVGQFPLGKFATESMTQKKLVDFIVPPGGSFVPAIVRDFARFGDKKRETKVQDDWLQTHINQLKAVLPGYRKTLPERTTALGQTIDEPESILGSTQARGSKLIDELSRYKWFPAHSTYDNDGKKWVERPLELRKEIADGLTLVVNSPEYDALPDDEAKQNWVQKATGIILKDWERDHPDDVVNEKKKEKAEESKEVRGILKQLLER